jgi:DNA-binding GntR family transcriptional regulator
LREAMRQLESEGLVTLHPNRGVFVADLPTEELFGVLLPVRLVVERYAVTKAVGRLTNEDFAELEHLIQIMEEGARKGDIEAINEADLRFHELTVTASGAAHATQLWRSVFPRIRAQIYRYAPLHEALTEIPAEHQELLSALRSSDATAIATALENHIVGTSRMLQSLKDRDLPARCP